MAPIQPVIFTVAESYVNGGIRAPDAAVKYGSRMLTLAEVYPFFGDHTRWATHHELLQKARPVWTRTHAILSMLPLSEVTPWAVTVTFWPCSTGAGSTVTDPMPG